MPESEKTSAEYGAQGGRRRAEKLTPEERSRIAREGALARWSPDTELPRVLCGSPDRPLRIANIEIPCYVLEDETRVLSQRGVVGGLGMKYGTRIGGADRLTNFLSGKSIFDNVSSELMALIADPIKFRGSGGITFGYPATILADICEAVLAARKAGTLQKQQEHIADRAEILVRGFARVGIIALVDEATGFQEIRARDDLHKILEAYIAKELLPWTKRFPNEFHKEMFRVWGWPWPPAVLGYRGPQGPRYASKLTNMLVYDQLPPGVVDALKEKTPPDDRWQRRERLHQHLTAEIGQPHLEKQVAVATNLMKVCDDKDEFIRKFERAFPGTFRKGQQLSFMEKLGKK
jgi:P63C domain